MEQNKRHMFHIKEPREIYGALEVVSKKRQLREEVKDEWQSLTFGIQPVQNIMIF